MRAESFRWITSGRWAASAVAVAAALGAVLAPVGTSAPTAAPERASRSAAADALAERIDAILDDPRYDGSQVGVVVRSAETGELLYARNPGRRQLPASNVKLFSSTAALELLGPDYRFRTQLLTDGTRDGSRLTGDLFIRGGGDPTMLAGDYRSLAARLAASGVQVVDGDLVADDTFFDDVRLGNSWSWDDEPYYYSAQTSALTVAPNTDYDSGTVIVRVRPGAAGGRPEIVLQPRTSYLRVVNRAVTGPAGSDDTISVVRRHGRNVIDVTGSIPAGSAEYLDWATVWEPTGYAADVFRRALAGQGIRVTGAIRYAGTPTDARPLVGHDSMTVGRMLTPFLKLSNNMHAEALVKTVGAETADEGSWDAGLAAMTEALAGLGVRDDTMRLVDGSGLSRRNLVPPGQLVRLLMAARGEPWFPAWYDALPVAGASARLVGGTLRYRMGGTAAAFNLHAKTGSLTGVSALSGYVTDADDELLVFSVVSNNYLASSVKDVEDAIGVTLARFSRDAAVRSRTPRFAPARPADPLPAALECTWARAC